MKALALGTVQLGLSYGVSNKGGQVPESEARAILAAALELGIDTLDTARAYGTSERVIGGCADRSFKTVTKVKTPAELAESLRALNAREVHGLLLHREEALLEAEGDLVWNALSDHKREGRVRKIGVSSHSPEALAKILARFPVDLIQVPFNLLDRRFFTPELVARYLEKRVEVHARSVFLQGLLFLDEPRLPPPMKAFAVPTLRRVAEIAKQLGATPARLSLSLATRHPSIHRTVVGVTSARELRELAGWEPVRVPPELNRELGELWRLTEGRIVDPLQWGIPLVR